MILIDFSGVALSNVHSDAKNLHKDDFTEDYFRHSVIHSLRSSKVRFSEYGEVVICVDCAPYWRKTDVMQEYKANRKKAKAKSDIPWEDVYKWMNNLLEDFKGNGFPWKVVGVHSLEADDIIAALAKKYHTREKVLIVSNDGDLTQLTRYNGVKQFSPMKKDYLRKENIIESLAEKVLRGDSGDGIPSIKCDSNHFVREDKVRAKPMKKTEVELWRKLSGLELMKALPEEYHKNYIRNKTLIDLNYVPEHLTTKAIEEYENTDAQYNMMQLVAYFSKNRMRRLLEYVEDFA